MLSSKDAANVFRLIAHSRHSCKRFQRNKVIPGHILKDIIKTSLTAPSGFNIQPTNVILVQNPQVKEALAKSAMLGPGNMFRANDASAIAVFLSDLEPHKRLDRIVELERNAGVRTKDYLAMLPVISTFLMGEGTVARMMKQVATDIMSPVQPMPTIDSIQAWSYKNTSLMAQTLVLSATSHGLSTCLMEGYDSRRVKDVLKIPDRYDVPLMCGIGYEYEGESAEKLNRAPRLEAKEVFFSDYFGQELDLSEDDEHVVENSESVQHEQRCQDLSIR